MGRQREFARAVTAVTAEGGRGAILAGAAGVGKTHLLALVADRLQTDGWTPLVVRGDSARRWAFGSLGDLLPSLSGDPRRWAMVLRRGLDQLVARAGDGRPLLVADDLHEFDPASAALVQQAVLEGRIKLIGTMRTGAEAPDAVTALWKDDLVERHDIGALRRHEADDLAELLVGGSVDGETRERLWGWAQGNPLVLTEVVEQGRNRRDWRQVTGLWHLEATPSYSPRLGAVLAERLSECPPTAVDLVDAVAIAGHLSLAVADRLVGRAVVGAVERARLLRTELVGDRWIVTLEHPLFIELRRRELPAERVQALEGRLLDVYEQMVDPTAADIPLVAEWYLDAGRTGPRTAAVLTAAAERAWVSNEPSRAARLARRAWELHPDDRNGHVLVSALARLGETDELQRVAPAVIATAKLDRVRAQAVLCHSLSLFQFSNRPAEALEVLEAGAGSLADPGWRDILTVEAASYALQMGQIRSADEVATGMLMSSNPRAAADAAAVVAPARTLQGRIAEAIEVSEQGLQRASSLDEDDFADVGQHAFHYLNALIDGGRLPEAQRFAEAAMTELARQADRFSRSFMALSLGRIARLRGRPRTAARWFSEAIGAFATVRRAGFEAWSLAGLASVRAELGEVAAAEASAAHCRKLADHPVRVAAAEVARSLAWVLVAAGRPAIATERIRAAADQAAAADEVIHAGHALHDLVRLGDTSGTTDLAQTASRLGRLAARSDSELLACYAAHGRAAAERDLDALESVAGRFERMGCDLLAAEVWAEVAVGLGDRVQPRRRAAARRRASVLARRCEGAQTPRLSGLAPGVQLSPREREVAGLVAAGLRRREIADRLVVSQRTVDSHLQRVYQKLGVNDRAGLLAALDDGAGDLPNGHDLDLG